MKTIKSMKLLESILRMLRKEKTMKKNIMIVVRNIRSMKKWYDIQELRTKGHSKKEIENILGISRRTIQRLWDKKFEDWNVNELLENLPKTSDYVDELNMLSIILNKPFSIIDLMYNKSDEEIKKCEDETRKFVDMVRTNFIKKYPYYDISGILKSMKS